MRAVLADMVSARPISAINTRTVKVDHRSTGELFEGLDIPDPEVMSGIKVKRSRLGVRERPQKRTYLEEHSGRTM